MNMSSRWHGRTAVVTGATGLVGSHLCHRLLAEGADVVAVVRDADPHSELFRSGDIDRVHVVSGAVDDGAGRTMERALSEYAPAYLFHLAAQTQVRVAQRNPLETFESNVRGTWLVLEAARRLARHDGASNMLAVVVASSDKAYGSAGQLPYVEDTPLRGTFPYDASKACTDIIAQSYAATFDVPVAIARCGNIFGGGDLNWDRLIPGTVRSLLRDERPIIRSNGKLVRDWIYVGDVVEAYLSLAAAVADGRPETRGGAFNFANEEPRDVLAVVRAIEAAVGVSLPPVIQGHAPAEIEQQHLSAQKARRALGWQPTFAFDDAMARTVAWYRAYLGQPAPREAP